MRIPQVITLVLIVKAAVTAIANDGKPQPPYDGDATFFAGFIVIVILGLGGFWTGGRN